MTWNRVTRYSQLKPGDAVRLVGFPRIEGVFRCEAHGSALLHIPFIGRDYFAKLREIEVKAREGME